MADFTETHRNRLVRKIAKKDQKIKALEKKIAELEHELATSLVQVKRLPTEVARAVQQALCNVRMIPVLGLGRDQRIVEVRHVDPNSSKSEESDRG